MDILPIELPADLRPHADVLALAAAAGVELTSGPSFDLVTSWCETMADECGLLTGEHGGSFPFLQLEDALVSLDVLEICDQMDVDEEEATSDAVLIAAMRQRLATLLNEGDLQDEVPLACDITIAGTDSRFVSLCFYLSGADSVMGGPDIEWAGVYRSLDAFREKLRSEGALTSVEEAAAIPDERLVEIWRGIH
jgi:hypothetical protein